VAAQRPTPRLRAHKRPRIVRRKRDGHASHVELPRDPSQGCVCVGAPVPQPGPERVVRPTGRAARRRAVAPRRPEPPVPAAAPAPTRSAPRGHQPRARRACMRACMHACMHACKARRSFRVEKGRGGGAYGRVRGRANSRGGGHTWRSAGTRSAQLPRQQARAARRRTPRTARRHRRRLARAQTRSNPHASRPPSHGSTPPSRVEGRGVSN